MSTEKGFIENIRININVFLFLLKTFLKNNENGFKKVSMQDLDDRFMKLVKLRSFKTHNSQSRKALMLT